jgi:hypothetical protein
LVHSDQDSGRADIAGEVGVVIEEGECGNRDGEARREPEPGSALEHFEEVVLAAEQPTEDEKEAEVREQGRDWDQ